MNESTHSHAEEFGLEDEKVLDKVKAVIHAGNVRRIILKNDAGKVYMEIPLTWGLIGAALLPLFAAVSALAGLLAVSCG